MSEYLVHDEYWGKTHLCADRSEAEEKAAEYIDESRTPGDYIRIYKLDEVTFSVDTKVSVELHDD